MTSYNISGLLAPGMTANKYTGNDWAFQGNTAFEPVYEDNFEADINAITESVGDDSGYFSNDTDTSEANTYDTASYEEPSSHSKVEIETAGSDHQEHNFYPDVAASNQSNHGSIYNGTLNKSTTHLEKDSSFGKPAKETRMSKTVYHPVHEYEHKTLHKYSIKSEACDQRPLEIWKAKHEDHEWLAYRLEQPANPQSKRRKTGSKK
jgi:hypothetical protein